MNKLISILIASMLLLTGCNGFPYDKNISSIKSKEPDITNLTYNNGSAQMGDNDGPAYAIYSKKVITKHLLI